MKKTVRASYTLEFKREAARLVTGCQSIAAAARSLGVVEHGRGIVRGQTSAELPQQLVSLAGRESVGLGQQLLSFARSHLWVH